MAIKIPNLILRRVLEGFLDVIREDYQTNIDNSTESESWLYRVFNGVIFGEWDFYKQSIELLIKRNDNSPRKLEIYNSYPKERPHVPTIYITSPSESKGQINSIGFGQDTNEYYENGDGSIVSTSNRGNSGYYEYMITSSNYFEVELIYRLIEAIFIGNNTTLSDLFNGEFEFSGKEIMTNFEMFPNLYIKSWGVKVNYTQKVPSLSSTAFYDAVQFTLTDVFDN